MTLPPVAIIVIVIACLVFLWMFVFAIVYFFFWDRKSSDKSIENGAYLEPVSPKVKGRCSKIVSTPQVLHPMLFTIAKYEIVFNLLGVSIYANATANYSL